MASLPPADARSETSTKRLSDVFDFAKISHEPQSRSVNIDEVNSKLFINFAAPTINTSDTRALCFDAIASLLPAASAGSHAAQERARLFQLFLDSVAQETPHSTPSTLPETKDSSQCRIGASSAPSTHNVLLSLLPTADAVPETQRAHALDILGHILDTTKPLEWVSGLRACC